MKATDTDSSGEIFQHTKQLRAALLITAAGNSSRFGSENKKQFFPFYGETVLHHTFVPFIKIDLFEFYCMTIPPGYQKEARIALGKRMIHTLGDRLVIADGGETRQESVLLGLKALSLFSPDIVLIHDGARPRVTHKIIKSVYDKAVETGASAPIIPSVDAMKTINSDGTIKAHLDRPVTVGIQTPQAYYFKDILEAYEKAENDGYTYIDDSEIFHRYKGKVHTVEGDPENAKITYYSDITSEEAGK
ncbi:MAG: 2-C-methyl-D-erythritol 4-phosphate cytidylyltransferase [Spirochaetales bacterium]|nr:2-C-methyl-D-erythritol 4-phosphate cytidylyltransferase [Spirochaetales bacterium]